MDIAYVSPHITREQWESGEKSNVDVFEDQLRGWLFEQARAIAPNPDSGPAILALISPFFEVMACYLKGESSRQKETEFLRYGLEAVFPDIDSAARKEYINEVRHAFAHEAMFRKVLLHRSEKNFPSFGMVNGLLHLDRGGFSTEPSLISTATSSKVRIRDASVIGGFMNFMLIRMGDKVITKQP